MTHAFTLAYRNIWRNKTRSLLSLLAIGIGMALLLPRTIYERTREPSEALHYV
jgi:hypothetical protein